MKREIPEFYLDGKTRRKIHLDEFGTPRNQWDQPMIWQPDGTMRGYTRVSGLAKALDTTDGLMFWSNAMTAIGLGLSPQLYNDTADLVEGSDNPYTEFKSQLGRLVKDAQEFAGAHIKRELGTELHHWAEVVDRTGDLDLVPAELRVDINAYLWATVELEVLETELFVVTDEVCAAGTLDRLNRMPDGRIVVGDLKSGQGDSERPMAVEMQVATYAHGVRYDRETGERSPLHLDIDLDEGLLIHAPSGKGECQLYPLDLRRGWKNVLLACEVRQARKDAGAKLKPLVIGMAA